MIKIVLEKLGKNQVMRLGRGIRRFFDGLRTLRWKLLLTYLFVSIIPMLVLWGTIVTILEDHIMEQRVSELRSLASGRASALGEEYINEPMRRVFPNQLMQGLFRLCSDYMRQAYVLLFYRK